MDQGRQQDWLRVVYGSARGGEAPTSGGGTGVHVRQSPAVVDPARAPGGAQRVRVTVVPSEPALAWSLYLRDFGPGPGDAPTTRISWRVDPGTWQPLAGTRQCVAQGRGRIRLDVELRFHPPETPGAPPRLRFVAEAG